MFEELLPKEEKSKIHLSANDMPVFVNYFHSQNSPMPRLDIYNLYFKKVIEYFQRTTGAIVFRGFPIYDSNGFYNFVQSFNHDLLSYDYGSTPRSHLGKRVYTSTEYPSDQTIPLHNEQAYTLQWPLSIWFHSITVAKEGGETPIADSRLVYKKIPPDIRKRFESKKLLYTRNYGNGLDIPWQKTFNTNDRSKVECFALQNNISLEWKEDGELRTRQLCQATAKHPFTSDWVWFNQAHLFHISNLEPMLRETLLECIEEEDLPRNVYYGDGSPIEESILNEIRAIIDSVTVKFPWQRGDVMLLDNMLVAHGRSPYKGERKVEVAMTEAFDSTAPDNNDKTQEQKVLASDTSVRLNYRINSIG